MTAWLTTILMNSATCHFTYFLLTSDSTCGMLTKMNQCKSIREVLTSLTICDQVLLGEPSPDYRLDFFWQAKVLAKVEPLSFEGLRMVPCCFPIQPWASFCCGPHGTHWNAFRCLFRPAFCPGNMPASQGLLHFFLHFIQTKKFCWRSHRDLSDRAIGKVGRFRKLASRSDNAYLIYLRFVRASLDLLHMLLIKVKVCLKMFDGCSQVRDGLLKEKQARVEKARWEALSHWGKVSANVRQSGTKRFKKCMHWMHELQQKIAEWYWGITWRQSWAHRQSRLLRSLLWWSSLSKSKARFVIFVLIFEGRKRCTEWIPYER